MGMTINMKRNDTKGIFVDTLKVDGAAVDLSADGTLVRFMMRRMSKPYKLVNQAAEITSGLTGDVRYVPILADIDTEGTYEQEWEVTFPSGKVLTFPNGDYNTVNIRRDLADAQDDDDV